ncbi:unnamed protein product [Calypogeia fissa]
MGSRKLTAPKFEVEKFDGKVNFSLWGRKVTNVLIQQGLEKTITGIKPSDVTDADWEDMTVQACNTIELFLANNILKNVLGMKRNAKDIWDTLTQLYQDKSLTTRIYQLERLFKLKMKEGGNMRDHLNIFDEIVHEVTTAGDKLSDEYLAIHLLMSLPKSYSTLVTVITHDKLTLKLEMVKSTILAEWSRRHYC